MKRRDFLVPIAAIRFTDRLPGRRIGLMKIRLLTTMVFVCGIIGSAQSTSFLISQSRDAALKKIAPWVLQKTIDGRQAEFLVIMSDQASLSGAEELKTKKEKGRYVYETLYRKAQETQGQLLNWLQSRGIFSAAESTFPVRISVLIGYCPQSLS